MQTHLLILAAGKGSRMKSEIPKVLHPVLFEPMISHVLRTCRKLEPSSVSLVLGHGGKEIQAFLETQSEFKPWQVAYQKQQLGTGHAVLSAQSLFTGKKGALVVLSGDVPLLSELTLKTLISHHQTRNAKATLLTMEPEVPHGYGRIVRDAMGGVKKIVEERDASPVEKGIGEVNSGVYCFDVELVFQFLEKIEPQNAQGEYYLTDVIESFLKEGLVVEAMKSTRSQELAGINDREGLYGVQTTLQQEINTKWMREGVTLLSPQSTLIDARTHLETDITIESQVTLIDSHVQKGTYLESGVRLQGSKVGPHCILKQGSALEDSEVGESCRLGPYAHLRPGSRLLGHNKIGNFVEVKKSTLKIGAQASHLSYIGDATVGENTNLGCGFITCNYDGHQKSHTEVGRDVFVGSDSQLVAPIKIGDGAYVASGSTVTEDVPPDALVISRNRQTVKKDYAKLIRSKWSQRES